MNNPHFHFWFSTWIWRSTWSCRSHWREEIILDLRKSSIHFVSHISGSNIVVRTPLLFPRFSPPSDTPLILLRRHFRLCISIAGSLAKGSGEGAIREHVWIFE